MGGWLFYIFLFAGLTYCKISSPLRLKESYKTVAPDGEAKNHIRNIPKQGLPYRWVVRNLEDMLGYKDPRNPRSLRSLIGNELNVSPQNKPWGSAFWPEVLNGVAARWQKGVISNFLGNGIKGTYETLYALLERQQDPLKHQWIDKLSAVEKYDLLVGSYSFSATTIELSIRGELKNKNRAVWEGFCNGAAAASIKTREPVKTVEVRNPDGFLIKFYPDDIKALLALAYYELDHANFIGDACFAKNPQVDQDGRMVTLACRDLNPATFLIALVNRVGITQDSFVIETDRLQKIWNYPIDSAKIDLLAIPFSRDTDSSMPLSEAKTRDYPMLAALFPDKIIRYTPFIAKQFPHADKNTAYLVHVSFDIAVADQLWLPKSIGTIEREESDKELPIKKLIYRAIIELDENFEIIGGEWLDQTYGIQPEDAPDFAWFPGEPMVQSDGVLKVNHAVNWNVIAKLYYQSAQMGEEQRLLRIPPLSSNSVESSLTQLYRRYFYYYFYHDGRFFGM